MLQRNISGGALLLPTLDPPIQVPPGGEIDHPEPLAGFIPVEAPGQDTSQAAPTAPPAAPGSKPKKSVAAGARDEGARA